MGTLDHEQEVSEILAEAFAEDEREGFHFDRMGFFNFFPEELKRDAEAVEEAWFIYENEVNGDDQDRYEYETGGQS